MSGIDDDDTAKHTIFSILSNLRPQKGLRYPSSYKTHTTKGVEETQCGSCVSPIKKYSDVNGDVVQGETALLSLYQHGSFYAVQKRTK